MLFSWNFSKENLIKSKRRFYLIGGIMSLLGLLSLSMPLLASFAIETLIGCLILAVGVCQAVNALKGFGEGDRPWQSTFMAVISFAAGAIFLLHPLAGIITIGILLSAYFMADGITKVIEYFRLREINGSGWVLVSGILGIILSVMMWKNFFTGASMVGIILGINLLFSGISLIILGRGCSRASENCKR
jgi:uncharacterized membrane protein HdeD (DUF308 family)